MKESKLFKSLVATFVVIVIGGPAVVLAGTPSYSVNLSEIQRLIVALPWIDQANIEGPKTTVSYADLNLESEEDVQVLYRRLQQASREVCSPKSLKNIRSPFVNYESSACYRHTLSDAVDNFDNDDLTRIHAG